MAVDVLTDIEIDVPSDRVAAYVADRPGPAAAPGLVEHFFRHEYSRLVAVLTRVAGIRHIEIVEDAVQTALMNALTAWTASGLPEDPGAWLYRAAYNNLIGDLRRKVVRIRILERAADDLAAMAIIRRPRISPARFRTTCCG